MAPIKTKFLKAHNHVRQDDYYWLKKRDNKAVISYINDENRISTAFFNSQQNVIKKLLAEFDGRIDPNEQYSPFEMNGKMYQSRMISGMEYGQVIELSEEGGKVFFDENTRAKGFKYYELAGFSISPDNKILAIAEDYVGRRQYKISFIDIATGEQLQEEIKNTSGFFAWAQDSKTIYYSTVEKQSLRSNKVFKHVIHSPNEKDMLIFEEKNKLFNAIIISPNWKKSLFIVSVSSSTTKYYEMASDGSATTPVLFMKTEKGHEYKVLPHDNGYYILSNYNAENRQILFSKKRPESIADCQVLIPHDSSIHIENVSILKNTLIIQQRKKGLDEVKLLDLNTLQISYVPFKEETFYVKIFELDKFESNYFYFSYNSMTTPRSTYKYNIETGEQSLIFRYKILDENFEPENYISKRVWFKANDGTEVPATILYKKSTLLKKAPCLLTGYGAYGLTLIDEFDSPLLSMLDRGFVYVNAHVRGERYLGESWYQDGKFLKKKNTFTDFINIAEQLGQKGYCDPERLYIQGSSAGGLLMANVINTAPHLFKGVIADVPFVDVLTTMMDERIPLTVEEFEEWGNPKDVEYYHYILSYSPYDNIRRIDYPHLMITTGYHDSQVQYWEPLKWIAKLRALRNNNNLLFLECNMDAGHGGGSGRSTERLERAKKFAFILSLEELE